MTRSSLSAPGILRGKNVEGVVFCSTSQEFDTSANKQKQEQEQLKTLEDFWLDKGFQQGLIRGVKEGTQKGFQDGFQQGLKQGKEEGVATAKEEFHKIGFEEGLAKAQADLTTLFKQGEELALGIAKQRETLVEELRPQLIQFCTQICEKILRKTLQNNPIIAQVIEDLIKEFEPLIKDQTITFVFSKEIQEELRSKLQSLFPESKSIQIEKDEWLSPGNFRLEFATGLVSFNIERQLDELEKLCLEKV